MKLTLLVAGSFLVASLFVLGTRTAVPPDAPLTVAQSACGGKYRC